MSLGPEPAPSGAGAAPEVPAGAGRFEGLGAVYEQGRPRLPTAVADVCCQLARADRPQLVVDLGSGPGGSLLLWSGRADRVVGIEPGADMRRRAEARIAPLPDRERFELRARVATATGLPDGAADIVTCSQALHWLEPAATFAEVARILRPGGVFCAADCDWPPLIDWELDRAYRAAFAAIDARERQLGLRPPSWDKPGHLERMRAGGWFRWAGEAAIHHVEPGDVVRLHALIASQGAVAALRAQGDTDQALGLDRLDAVAARVLDRPRPFWFTYRLRLGVV